jgi:hypothetical protein
MQFSHQHQIEVSGHVGWGVRVLLLAGEGAAAHDRIVTGITALGGVIDTETDGFAALETLSTDRTGFGLFVIDCDPFGGLEVGRKLISLMHKGGVSMPVILVSTECPAPEFPADINAPIVLRAPLSAVAMRVGFEYATRGRLVFHAA